MLQEETIRRNERERKASNDKMSNLERQLQLSDSEKRQCQEKIAKLKTAETKLNEEKQQLKKLLEETEQKATEIEMARRAAEGEIQRLSMVLNDRDTEIQVYQERVENVLKQLQDREDRCQSLHLSIDRLSL